VFPPSSTPPRGTPAQWLHVHTGGKVFPLHPRTKTPAVASWDDYQCKSVDDAGKLVDYAVALGSFGVADSDTPEAEAWIAEYLPDTPFKVRTARGMHRYYRLRNLDAPKYIYRDGLTIEFRNSGQYVVGPGSTHATGYVYTAEPWSWEHTDVPFFPVELFRWDDRPPSMRGSSVGALGGYVAPEEIRSGERHDQMYRMCRALRVRGVPLAGALQACLIENRIRCKPPLPQRAIERHLNRVYFSPMKVGWTPYPMDAWRMFCNLAESGMSRDALVAAAQAIDPTFDPEHPPTEEEGLEALGVLLLEPDRDMYGQHWSELSFMDANGVPIPPPTNGTWSLVQGIWKFKRTRGSAQVSTREEGV
jgi:hypothetical protein